MKTPHHLSVAATAFLIAATFTGWASCSSYQAQETVIDGSITVSETANTITLIPEHRSGSLSYMFYPGGLVNPDAYLRPLSKIAEKGIPVLIVKMPSNLAILAPEKGLDFIESIPGTSRWIIGGHSLGGVMAARTVRKAPEHFAGIVFLASYPESSDLKKEVDSGFIALSSLSISGSLDGLATPEKMKKNEVNYPANTVLFVIEGGNHSQFGNYGFQKGDNKAIISMDEQHEIIAEQTVAFIKSLEK